MSGPGGAHPRSLTPAQSAMVEQYMDVVDKVAAKFRGAARKHGQEDVRSAAKIGLCEAATTFDPSKGVPFPAFAWARVIGAVMNFTEREEKYRDIVRKCLQSGDQYAEMQEDQGEIEDTEDDSRRRVQDAMAGMFTALAVGFFSAAGRLASESTWVQSHAYRAAEATLHEVVASLPERDRRVITMRYFEDRGLEEIAEALSVSYISARRYHHAALQRLGARLSARNVDAGSLADA